MDRKTPLKRGKPPERKTPLRTSIEQVSAWQRKPRKPLPKVGPAKLRTRPAERRAKAALVARSGGRCEAFGIRYTRREVVEGPPSRILVYEVEVCGMTLAHMGDDPHHLWTSDRDRNMHDPARMLLVCRAAHNWIGANPELARELGLYKRDGDA